MSINIIGREEESQLLENLLVSKSPEFLAICGRRRVGKTFLIKQFFQDKDVIFFNITGLKDGDMESQIRHFTVQISKVFYRGASLTSGKNWDDAFELLTKAIQHSDPDKKIVVFLDEFPWMATLHSKLLQNLDYYWNQYWSSNQRIKLIICGSSASWIIDNIVNNRGGLHNRLTRNIYLEPFNLVKTRQFLESRDVKLNDNQILEIFMIMGGVPFYLEKIEKGLSATQLIELLAFRRKSFLLEEFDNLFSSLFDDAEVFISLIRFIGSYRYGIGQNALLKKFGTALSGQGGVRKLKVLEEAGFIMSFKPLFHKKRGIYYRLTDHYTLFYLSWIEPVKDSLLKKSLLKGYWSRVKKTPAWNSWSGIAFEAICYEHLPQITLALDLSPTSIPGTWRYSPQAGDDISGAQIDLLFDRDDDSITICEIKYSREPFVITKDYAAKLEQKISVFRKITRTKKQLFLVMISANGIKPNGYSDRLISGVVTLDDLFRASD